MALILTCYNHPGTPATATCAACDEPICDACVRPYRGETLCPADYAIARREAMGEVARAPRRNPPPPTQSVTRRPETRLKQREPAPLQPMPRRPMQRYYDEYGNELAGFEYDPRLVTGVGRRLSNATLILAILGLLFGFAALGGIFLASDLVWKALLLLAAIPGLITSGAAWSNRYEARDPGLVLLLSVLGASLNGVITLLMLLALCLPFIGLHFLIPFL